MLFLPSLLPPAPDVLSLGSSTYSSRATCTPDSQMLAYLTVQLDTNEVQAYVTCHASSLHTPPSSYPLLLRPLLAIFKRTPQYLRTPTPGTHKEYIATLDTL